MPVISKTLWGEKNPFPFYINPVDSVFDDSGCPGVILFIDFKLTRKSVYSSSTTVYCSCLYIFQLANAMIFKDNNNYTL